MSTRSRTRWLCGLAIWRGIRNSKERTGHELESRALGEFGANATVEQLVRQAQEPLRLPSIDEIASLAFELNARLSQDPQAGHAQLIRWLRNGTLRVTVGPRRKAGDARELRAMRRPWTDALARMLEAGAAVVTGAHARGREELKRAHGELADAGITAYATVVRRRLGELTGGAEGDQLIAEADAWMAAQGIRAPGRFAGLYLPPLG